ncbi:type III pantothenate kinase [Mesoplasma syrphidae]|uniref:Type III pantothenate kinase n=1 Tax=Mesoplasma syrphidae TaxID=225999 RepID=A0A2K9BJ69_9MOLU|nr:type III pantothenate kinase [Mesoplasma syrphidae]AUF83346.1 type III pantothenate kinase [Mesoplasma syrphidae]
MKIIQQNYILIDIGNTYTKVYNKQAQLIFRKPTAKIKTIAVELAKLDFDVIVYSKVLNPNCEKIINAFPKPSHDIREIILKNKKKLTVFADIDLNELGTDIALGIVGAISKGHQNFIIIDNGTACTLSVVKNSKFIGVNIYPGWDNLKDHFQQDTQISTTEITHTTQEIGIDTNSALYNGIYKMYWDSLSKDIKKYQQIYQVETCFDVNNEIVLGFQYLLDL